MVVGRTDRQIQRLGKAEVKKRLEKMMIDRQNERMTEIAKRKETEIEKSKTGSEFSWVIISCCLGKSTIDQRQKRRIA